MSSFTFILIIISVFLSVVAQILLKYGMSSDDIQIALNMNLKSASITIFSNIYILFGLFTYVSSAGTWLLVLSKIEVSKAYPFVGLGFIFLMFMSYFFLDEPITLSKSLGTFLVFTGVVLISR